jgi:phosphoglucomutase
MLILTKTCSCCGEEKEFTEFTRNKGSKWGFHNKCKVCCAKRVAEFHKNNPGKKAISARKHYLNNIDKIANSTI